MNINLKDKARDDLVMTARMLIKSKHLVTPEEVVNFFAAPWEWKLTLEEWKDAEDNNITVTI